MLTMLLPPSPFRLRRAAARNGLLAALVAAAMPALAAGCPPTCITPDGVKNAAGVDPKLFSAIGFSRGEASVDASAATMVQIVREWRGAGGKAVLRLTAHADSGLQATPAARLAAARATAVKAALVSAGMPAAKVDVTAKR